jgi:hypothetical protein
MILMAYRHGLRVSELVDQRVSEVLSHALARSSLVTVPGASHFMIATHTPDVARLIGKHVATIETPH